MPTPRGQGKLIKVHIVEHDHRRLSTQFQSVHALHVLHGLNTDDLSNLGRSGEGQLVDAGMRGQRRPRLLAPVPVTTLTTPGGSPASRQSSARRMVVSGVSSAGFRTIVFPQARAGASFQIAMFSGKFQGVMAPTTPTGSFLV